MKRDVKDLAATGAIVATITCLINWGIFVTWREMTAYAAPKEDVVKMAKQLNRMELKLNELCIKQNIKIDIE